MTGHPLYDRLDLIRRHRERTREERAAREEEMTKAESKADRYDRVARRNEAFADPGTSSPEDDAEAAS